MDEVKILNIYRIRMSVLSLFGYMYSFGTLKVYTLI